MAFLELSTHRLHYRIDGERGPWLAFCNSLGTDLSMWDAQAEALSGSFRVLRYDRRGHGASDAPPAPYPMAAIGRTAGRERGRQDVEISGAAVSKKIKNY